MVSAPQLTPVLAQWFIPWAKEGKLLNQISQEEEDRLRAWLEAETATKGM
jgi:hypothetical protein